MNGWPLSAHRTAAVISIIWQVTWRPDRVNRPNPTDTCALPCPPLMGLFRSSFRFLISGDAFFSPESVTHINICQVRAEPDCPPPLSAPPRPLPTAVCHLEMFLLHGFYHGGDIFSINTSFIRLGSQFSVDGEFKG